MSRVVDPTTFFEHNIVCRHGGRRYRRCCDSFLYGGRRYEHFVISTTTTDAIQPNHIASRHKKTGVFLPRFCRLFYTIIFGISLVQQLLLHLYCRSMVLPIRSFLLMFLVRCLLLRDLPTFCLLDMCLLLS